MEHLIDESDLTNVTAQNINSNYEDTVVNVKKEKNKKHSHSKDDKEASMI